MNTYLASDLCRGEYVIVADCVARLCDALAAMPHESRGVVRAESSDGRVWATFDVSPMTDTQRAIFPNHPGGFRGDTNRRGQSGVMFRPGANDSRALATVVERARRMGCQHD